jgi:basic membrane protein A
MPPREISLHHSSRLRRRDIRATRRLEPRVVTAKHLAGLPGRARAAGPLTVGFIYVGPKDDYGYNQAHAVAAKALKGLP